MRAYQPKTGAVCECRRGVQRDNCSNCEGTGMMIDFAAIRARAPKPVSDGDAPMDGTECFPGDDTPREVCDLLGCGRKHESDCPYKMDAPNE